MHGTCARLVARRSASLEKRLTMRARVQVDQPDGQSKTLDVSGESIRLGRDASCEVAVDSIAFPKVSGVHARIELAAEVFVLVPLSRTNVTLLNDATAEGSVAVRAGDRVRLGITGPTITILAIEPATCPSAARADGFEQTVQADVRHLALLRGTAQANRFDLGSGGIIGRNAGVVKYLLDHPHVSRTAREPGPLKNGRVVLADLGSSNGTFVNGQRLTGPRP